MYKTIAKPLLFQLPAEKAHHFTMSSFQALLKVPGLHSVIKAQLEYAHPSLKKELLGLAFPNPVGLAAGFDKNGKYYKAMAALGFGFIEVGTVTPKPQVGNPQPRLFRLPQDKALINRMGFNNEGVDALVKRLQNRPEHIIIGGNIGKNKTTPNEDAIDDYRICFEKLFPYVDYFVVNVSSPNTPDLRALQDKEPLFRILNKLQELNHSKTQAKPILLKIAPDLNNDQLNDVLEIVDSTNIAGIIATNTTIRRNTLKTSETQVKKIGMGGLSGAPLRQRSTEVIRYIRNNTRNSHLVIIGVGGISGARDALEKIEAGADLIQIYSGMIYEGPGLVKQIKQALAK